MKIRKTTEADFETVMAIYAHARAYMAAHGNPNQWGPTNWPPEALIHADIAADGTAKGTGAFCIQWAYDQCGHLRIDTHGDNTVMQGLLRKLGFAHCGTIYVREDHDPRLAFEKSGKWMEE